MNYTRPEKRDKGWTAKTKEFHHVMGIVRSHKITEDDMRIIRNESAIIGEQYRQLFGITVKNDTQKDEEVFIHNEGGGGSVSLLENKDWKDRRWRKLRSQTMKRYQYRCGVKGCNIHGAKLLTIHHITPRSEGGLDIYDNLIPLCESHHNAVEIEDIRTRPAIEHFVVDSHKERLIAPRTIRAGNKTSGMLQEVAKAFDNDYAALAKKLGYKRKEAESALMRIALNPDIAVDSEQLTDLNSRVIAATDDLIGENKITADNVKKTRIKKLRRATKILSSNDPRIEVLKDTEINRLAHETRNFISLHIDDMPVAQ